MPNLEHIALIFDIDGVIRDVAGSYLRALADTVEKFTGYRPTAPEIDNLKAEGKWNNDWEASQELIRRYLMANSDVLPTMPAYDQIVSFFQGRYRGLHTPWDGYITQEPLLVNQSYFQELTKSAVKWGFFSGATRASAQYVLDRLAISDAVLVAMEDAQGKPNPEGLLKAIEQLDHPPLTIKTVIYAGDTVADMWTIVNVRKQDQTRRYMAVGIIPPHVESSRRADYENTLLANGADLVLAQLSSLTAAMVSDII